MQEGWTKNTFIASGPAVLADGGPFMRGPRIGLPKLVLAKNKADNKAYVIKTITLNDLDHQEHKSVWSA